MRLSPYPLFTLLALFWLIVLFGQRADYVKPVSNYSSKVYKFNSILHDIYLSPNFGLFVSSAGKLSLFDGNTIHNIKYKVSRDTNSSATIKHFKRGTKYSIYFGTENYFYSLGKTLDTLPYSNSATRKYYFSLPQQNQNLRYGFWHEYPEKDELVSMIYKKQSGILVGQKEIKIYNAQKNKVIPLKNFPKQIILSYLNQDSYWFIITMYGCYLIDYKSVDKIFVKEIKEPIHNIREGKIFHQHGMNFFINKSGIFKVKVIEGNWMLEKILDSSSEHFTSDIRFFEISKDFNDIFICGGSSSELVHYRKENVMGLFMASLNSILVTDSFIFGNNKCSYNFASNQITTDSILGTYSCDYSRIDDDTYLVNHYEGKVQQFSKDFKIKDYANIQLPYLWLRFFNYRDTIYFAGQNKLYFFDKNRRVQIAAVTNKTPLDSFDYCYSWQFFDSCYYLGTNRGIYIFNPNKRELYKHPQLSIEEIRTLVYIKEFNCIVAFSYGNGPYLLKKDKVFKLPLDKEKDLLYAHHLILRDSLAFVSSNNGVFVLSFSDWIEDKKVRIVNFYKISMLDGLPSNECNSGSLHSMVYDSIRNQILVSTINGIGIIPIGTQIIQWPNVQPKIISTQYSNKEYYGCKDTIASYSNLDFYVSMPYFGNPKNAQIEFRVHGVFDQWSALEDGKISLPDNLYGEYVIELRVPNGFNTYLQSTYYVYFEPKWNQTIWFKLFIALIVLSGFTIILIWVKRNEVEKRKKVQELVDQRTQELNAALVSMTNLNVELAKSEQIKENLISVLAHDMKSPLKSISYTLDYLIKNNDQGYIQETRLEVLKDVKSSISQLSQFSTEFLKWYASNKEGFKIHEELLQLSEIIDPTLEIYQSIIERNGNKVEVYLEEDYLIYVDRELCKIIFRNLLDNANKYCQGQIIIESYLEYGVPTLLIKNDLEDPNNFDIQSIADKISIDKNQIVEDDNFKFGLSLIRKMAVLSKIDLSVKLEEEYLVFKLCFSIENNHLLEN